MNVTEPADTRYEIIADDLRVNVSSGILTLRDGTSGGVPVSGIQFGLPTFIYSTVAKPINVEGYSLQRFMNEFPRYSRISTDTNSLGAQILNPTSVLFDEILDEATRVTDGQTLRYYPLYETSTVTEYSFADQNDLNDYPAVSGRLGNEWFNLPMTIDQNQFWLAPPTRFEATTAKITDTNIMPWTTLSAGLNTPLSRVTDLPLYDRLWIHVSGAVNIRQTITEDVNADYTSVIVYGHWAADSRAANAPVRREVIKIDRNGPFKTSASWRTITKIEAKSFDAGAQIRAAVLYPNRDFNADYLVRYQRPIRNQLASFTYWQLLTGTDAFAKPGRPETAGEDKLTSTSSYVAKCHSLDIVGETYPQFNPDEIWQLHDRDGQALSGIIDIAPVPHARYLLALDSEANIHVFDTFTPAINLAGKTETIEPPARIELSWPKNAIETIGSYTLKVYPTQNIFTSAISINRYQWSLTHDGNEYYIDSAGAQHAFHHLSGWQTHNSGIVNAFEYTISSPGTYTFQLHMVDVAGVQYRTYNAHRQVKKQAINTLPLRGLSVAPSGIDFDMYARPWVTAGDEAIRYVMRADIGMWVPDERLLVTREPYDEVRRY